MSQTSKVSDINTAENSTECLAIGERIYTKNNKQLVIKHDKKT
jgi:hypothetical protein